MKIKCQSPHRLPRVSGFKSSKSFRSSQAVQSWGAFPGEGESPIFPCVSLAGASLCLLFSNFRFGMAGTVQFLTETGPDGAHRVPGAKLSNRVRVSVASDYAALRSPWIFATVAFCRCRLCHGGTCRGNRRGFLCADLGITPETRTDHAAYIASWLKVLSSTSARSSPPPAMHRRPLIICTACSRGRRNHDPRPLHRHRQQTLPLEGHS